MFRKISDNVKRAAIRLYERDLLNLEDILDCCGFSQRTWYRVLKWRETDVVNHPRGVRGHVRRLDIKYLPELIHDIPDYFLDELVNLTITNRFIFVHFITTPNELECAGMSCKKLKCIASECNEELCATFIARMMLQRLVSLTRSRRMNGP